MVDTNGIDPDDAKRKRKGNRDDDYLLAVAEAKLLIEAQEALGTPAKIAATTVLGILKASYAWVSNLEARLDGPGNFDFYLYASPGEKVKNDYKLRPGFKPSSNNLSKEQWKKEYSDYRRNTRNDGSYDGMDKDDVEAIEKSLNQSHSSPKDKQKPKSKIEEQDIIPDNQLSHFPPKVDPDISLQKQLEGTGQLDPLRSNPNLKGVDIEELLALTPREIERLLSGVPNGKRTMKQISKAFEARDLAGRGKNL